MVVTFEGMVIVFNNVQPAKALAPIFVTLFPTVNTVRFVQLANASLPISVTLPGMTILEIGVLENALVPIIISAGESVTLPKTEHPLNAPSPIIVTLSGMTILVIEVLVNAFAPITSTFEGMTTEANPVHPLKALLAILVSPVKYCSSLNDVIVVFPLKTSPKSVTAAASSSLSSPSPLVSQLLTQRASTFGSTKGK